MRVCVCVYVCDIFATKSTKQIWLFVFTSIDTIYTWNGLHFGTKYNANLLPFTHHSKWMAEKWKDWNKGHSTDNSLNHFSIAFGVGPTLTHFGWQSPKPFSSEALFYLDFSLFFYRYEMPQMTKVAAIVMVIMMMVTTMLKSTLTSTATRNLLPHNLLRW